MAVPGLQKFKSAPKGERKRKAELVLRRKEKRALSARFGNLV
jgi:hypothetical protein